MSVEFIDAWDDTNKVVKATLGYTSSGKKAFCPDENCGQPVFSKHYSISEDDGWSHYPGHRPCNHMHGEMCDWHKEWQNRSKEYNYRTEDWHKLNGLRIPDSWGFGRVIEFQNSYIKLDEINKRNSDYLSHNLKIDWMFNMTERIKISSIIFEYIKKHKSGRVFLDYGDKIIEYHTIEKYKEVDLEYIFNPKRIKNYEIKTNIIFNDLDSLENKIEEYKNLEIEIEKYKIYMPKLYEYLKKLYKIGNIKIIKEQILIYEYTYNNIKLENELKKSKICKEKQIENFGYTTDKRIWIKY